MIASSMCGQRITETKELPEYHEGKVYEGYTFSRVLCPVVHMIKGRQFGELGLSGMRLDVLKSHPVGRKNRARFLYTLTYFRLSQATILRLMTAIRYASMTILDIKFSIKG